MKYMAIIDADEKPVSCEFIGCNGNVAPYLIGATTNVEALEQEPCEDAISRETVANEFADWFGYNYQNQIFYKRIKSMPSVQPEQKEITMEDVKAYCEQRNLVVLTKELFVKMNNTADEIYLYLKNRERR